MSKLQWQAPSLVPCPIEFVLCLTEAQYAAALKDLRCPAEERPPFVPEGSDACVHHFKNEAGQAKAIVCVHYEDSPNPTATVGLLVHEAVHLWQAIRDDIGERQPSSEFEAYSIQQITQSLIEQYDARKPKDTKPAKRGQK